MKFLPEIYAEIGLEKKLIDLSQGAISIPYLDDYNNPNEYWYPHPPVLIPIFLGHGPFYRGIVNHFFLERKRTFVEFSLEWGYMSEFARNAKQIYSQMVLEMDMVADGLDEEILAFCDAIGFKEVEDVDQFSNGYGNIRDHYAKLIHLDIDTPLAYIQNIADYTGDFPSSEKNLNTKQISNSCSFEIADPSLLNDIPNFPKWLVKGTPKKELFNEYLGINDLKSAWLTLNSSGWLLADVADGLEQLKSKTDDKLFRLIADNWTDGWKNSSFNDGEY